MISTNEVFKYPLAAVPRFFKIIFSSATLIALKSAYFCDLPFLSSTLLEGCSEFRRISHLRYLRLKILYIYQLRKSTPRCVITCGNYGFLTFYSDPWALISCRTGIYLTIYSLNTLKNTLSDTSLYAELVRLFHAATGI